MHARKTGLMSLLLVVLVASACYPARSGGGGNRDAYVIGTGELQGVPADDIYEAIRLLRPAWLTQRSGRTPQVFVNGSVRGGLEELRTFRPEMVTELRYIDATDATTRWGTGFMAGVIDVTTR